MCAEQFHAVLLHFASFDIFADIRYVTDDCFLSLVVSHVHTRHDYGNFVLAGLPAYQQRHLESVLNAAARLVYRLRRYDHITDALAALHWLRLPERVDFKVAVTAFRVLHGLAWSSQSSFIVITTTASSIIPSVYCGTSLVSRSSICPLEFLATGHSVIALITYFPSTAQDIFFP